MQNKQLLLSVLLLFTLEASYAETLNIGLCIMATGKYIAFVKPLLDSAEKYFCPKHIKTYFVFTDNQLLPDEQNVCKEEFDMLLDASYHDRIVIINQKRLGWPHDTLLRFSVYDTHSGLFAGMDYMFAIDADMLFVDVEGDEILSERVATQHPGFNGKKPLWGNETPYERNTISTAYIPYDGGTYYFAGGFYGGLTREFVKMMRILTSNIREDLMQNYIAVWHDESHLNRYFIDNPPTIMLDRSYCFPEHGIEKGYPLCKPKLLALDKDHDAIRE